MRDVALLLTCEHAVNHVPEEWAVLFADCPEVLVSHRAFDPGASELASRLADAISAPCFSARVTRLLLDHNRSPHNRALWSEFSRGLPAADKRRLLDNYYRPFRDRAAGWIDKSLANQSRVVHISVHSFTPVLNGRQRAVDIGLLYDPARTEEGFFAKLWKSRIAACSTGLRIRCNVPYRGVSDSHLTSYRKLYESKDYVGIELEISQSLVESKDLWALLQKQLADCLRIALAELTQDE